MIFMQGSRAVALRPLETRFTATDYPLPGLDQLDLVPVRVLYERDYGRAAFHRTGLPRHIAAFCTHRVAGFGRVGHGDRDVPEGRPHVVTIDAVVVSELDHCVLALVAVSDEGELVLL